MSNVGLLLKKMFKEFQNNTDFETANVLQRLFFIDPYLLFRTMIHVYDIQILFHVIEELTFVKTNIS